MRQDKKKILDLLYDEPYKIGHWVGFKDLTLLHNTWLKSFLFSNQDQTLQAHRGSYKTTTLSLFLALSLIIYPNKTILFFRKTDTDVVEVITQTINILKTELFRHIVRVLYGTELAFLKETGSEIDTNLKTTTKGQSQLLGLGIGTSITGKHADVVVTDDIINIKDRTSRAEREKTKTQYMELQNVKNRGGRFINTGTPWHKDDAFQLMPNISRYDCYNTGLIEVKTLDSLRKSMTDSLFSANYELKHIADKDNMFRSPKFIDDETLLHNGISHIDASYGGEDGTAFTAFKRLSDGRIVGFGKRFKAHINDVIDVIYKYHSHFKLGSIYAEKNADKGYLVKELIECGYPGVLYNESMNKYIKISTYLKVNWDNIYWVRSTDPEYINEILDYSEFAEHDDCPDSAASLLRIFDNKVKLNTNLKGGL